MASQENVKRYLAYWFQLGKKVIINNGKEVILPKIVLNGDRYSQEFEDCWQKVKNPDSGDCYLENTHQTIQQLLSSKWEIEPCYRCEMPVPIIEVGIQPNLCTCSDLDNWPNNELPQPREPIKSQHRLERIRHSLDTKKHK